MFGLAVTWEPLLLTSSTALIHTTDVGLFHKGD
jgi:hypothetical protein